MSDIETLHKENWSYRVLKNNLTDEYFLNVICGSVGIYEITIKLKKAEIDSFIRDHSSLSKLAERVSRNSENFKDRIVRNIK